MSLLLYGGVLGAPFIQDDYAWLDCAADAARSLDHIFTLHISSFFRPLIHLYFVAMASLFGTAPTAFHLASLLIHALAAALMGHLAWQVLEDRALSLVAVALFVVLTVHAEVALWISAVTESLHAVAALSALIGFVSFLRHTGRSRWWRLAGALLCFALALAAKETSVVLLPLMGLVHLLVKRMGRSAPAPWWVYLPFGVLLAGYLALQYFLQQSSHLLADGSYGVGPHALTRTGRAIWQLLGHGWPLLLAAGLGQVLWPRDEPRRWGRTLVLMLLALGLVVVPMLPYALFRGPHLASRYLYLPTLAAAPLLAVALRWLISGRARLGQVVAVAAVLGVAAQGTRVAAAQSRRHLREAAETGAFVQAAAARPAPRLPVLILGSPLRGQHLRGAMRLLHPTRSPRFNSVRRLAPRGIRGDVWRWRPRLRRLEVVRKS